MSHKLVIGLLTISVLSVACENKQWRAVKNKHGAVGVSVANKPVEQQTTEASVRITGQSSGEFTLGENDVKCIKKGNKIDWTYSQGEDMKINFEADMPEQNNFATQVTLQKASETKDSKVSLQVSTDNNKKNWAPIDEDCQVNLLRQSNFISADFSCNLNGMNRFASKKVIHVEVKSKCAVEEGVE